jgi:hypothetical protein
VRFTELSPTGSETSSTDRQSEIVAAINGPTWCGLEAKKLNHFSRAGVGVCARTERRRSMVRKDQQPLNDFDSHAHSRLPSHRRGPRNRYRCPLMLSVSDMPACLSHSTAATCHVICLSDNFSSRKGRRVVSPMAWIQTRFKAVRHRHTAERDEAIWLARDIFRDAVIHDLRGFNADIDWHRVVALQGWRHDDLKVDPHLV